MSEKYAIHLTDRRERVKYYIQVTVNNNEPTVEVVSSEGINNLKGRREIGLEDITVSKLKK